MPDTPMVAVFDTAFHQTMPEEAYLYGLPYEYYEKYKVRRYGFHGTSHSYVSKRAAEILGKDYNQMKTIVCHLGNGASISAVDGGKSVETSMGLTPLELSLIHISSRTDAYAVQKPAAGTMKNVPAAGFAALRFCYFIVLSIL